MWKIITPRLRLCNNLNPSAKKLTRVNERQRFQVCVFGFSVVDSTQELDAEDQHDGLSVQDPTSDSEDRDFKFNVQEIARATASEFYKKPANSSIRTLVVTVSQPGPARPRTDGHICQAPAPRRQVAAATLCKLRLHDQPVSIMISTGIKLSTVTGPLRDCQLSVN